MEEHITVSTSHLTYKLKLRFSTNQQLFATYLWILLSLILHTLQFYGHILWPHPKTIKRLGVQGTVSRNRHQNKFSDILLDSVLITIHASIGCLQTCTYDGLMKPMPRYQMAPAHSKQVIHFSKETCFLSLNNMWRTDAGLGIFSETCKFHIFSNFTFPQCVWFQFEACTEFLNIYQC